MSRHTDLSIPELAEHLANLTEIHQHYYLLGASHEHHQWLTREMSRVALALQDKCLKYEKELEDEQSGEPASGGASEPKSRRPAEGRAQGDGDQPRGGEPAGEAGGNGLEN